MTTITTTIPDKVKRNAEIAWQSLSIHAAAAVSIGVSVLLALGPAWATAFIAAHPILAPVLPFVGFGFVVLAKLVPQNIQTKSDKQAATVAWLVDLIGKALPGQPVTVPASVVASLGLPSSVVVTAPTAPPAAAVPTVFVDTAPAPVDMPLTPSVPAVAVVPAVVPPVDKMAAVRPMFPGLTDDQIRAELAVPKPQPAIVVPPFLQPQPAPGM